MPLHPAVRQTLADRLTVIQKELHETADVLREREAALRRITEYRERLVEEKDAIRASLTDEPAGEVQTSDGIRHVGVLPVEPATVTAEEPAGGA